MLTRIVFLIEQIAPGLYLLLGAGLLLLLRSAFRARRSIRGTQFELERDLARSTRGSATTGVILLIEALLIVFGVQWVVAPYLRETENIAIQIAQVMEDGEFRTPTPQPFSGGLVIDASGVVLGGDDNSDIIVATPTLTPTAVGTIIPNSPAPIGCDTPNATLQVPANGMIVFEPTIVRGTAFAEGFAYYRFELAGDMTGGSFAPLTQYDRPADAVSELGQFVPSMYDPGEYRFRLVVFDAFNNVTASCALTIFISEPIPTPTPLGTVSAPTPNPNATPVSGSPP